MSFGKKKKKGANEEVVRHWYIPFDNFSHSSKDFYDQIEQELELRNVPELKVSRLELSERGLLSDKRLYLRLKRERFVFDICAAPFGKSFFFSFRFVELPQKGVASKLIVCLLLASLTLVGAFPFLGPIAAAPAVVVFLIFLLWALSGSKETYYREDTRLMYLSTVETVTQLVVDRITAATGIKLIKRYDRTLREDDFKATQRQIEQKQLDQGAPIEGSVAEAV